MFSEQSEKVTSKVKYIYTFTRNHFGGDDIPESSGISALRLSPEQTERLTQLPGKNNVWLSEPAPLVTLPVSTNPSKAHHNIASLSSAMHLPITDPQVITEESKLDNRNSTRVSLRVIHRCKEANCWILYCCGSNVLILVKQSHFLFFVQLSTDLHWRFQESSLSWNKVILFPRITYTVWNWDWSNQKEMISFPPQHYFITTILI